MDKMKRNLEMEKIMFPLKIQMHETENRLDLV
jgi:hypothetical protein